MAARSGKQQQMTIRDHQRAATEQVQLQKVCDMVDMLEDVKTRTVDASSLGNLNVVLGPPLNIDDHDSDAFFLPWISESFIRESAEEYRDRWMDKLLDELKPAEWLIPTRKAQWFVGYLDILHELDPGIWSIWYDRSYIYSELGLDLPRYTFQSRGGHILREYQSSWAYLAVDESKPHIASFLFDSNEPPANNQVLRSEIDCAMELIKHRLECGRYTDHHTKPALIYTIERDTHARITQAYFDGKFNKLVLRQSRQLDLQGPEPTDDAFILMRWMTNRPVGATEYVDEEEEEDKAVASGDEEGAAPRMLVGCA